MSAPERNPSIPDKEVQVPEWEHSGTLKDGAEQKSKRRGTASGGISAKLDSVLPPHRRYFGRSRKTFLWILLALLLAVLALIIGLAVGLTKRSMLVTRPLCKESHF